MLLYLVIAVKKLFIDHGSKLYERFETAKLNAIEKWKREVTAQKSSGFVKFIEVGQSVSAEMPTK